jgi:hypothetical protein
LAGEVRREPRLCLVEPPRAVGRAVERVVVEDHRHPVGRRLDVVLEEVGTDAGGRLVRRHGVLGRDLRVPAVCDDGHVLARLAQQ